MARGCGAQTLPTSSNQVPVDYAMPSSALCRWFAIGLPDTVWSPEDGLARLPDDKLSLLLFPVERPELFDAVVTDDTGVVSEIQVKQRDARSRWIWGAIKMPGVIFGELHILWLRAERHDEYFATL